MTDVPDRGFAHGGVFHADDVFATALLTMAEEFCMTDVPDRGFTHGGVFHADDVFATALLTMLNPDIRVDRGPRVPDSFEGIVYDVLYVSGSGSYQADVFSMLGIAELVRQLTWQAGQKQ